MIYCEQCGAKKWVIYSKDADRLCLIRSHDNSYYGLVIGSARSGGEYSLLGRTFEHHCCEMYITLDPAIYTLTSHRLTATDAYTMEHLL